ncbi:MAG: hypothetical protein NTW86_24880 [Candidatus Sumerlaeota bacterium]|nr:hypothetical protein [Candidatus Sumerlaeota bacterium]
MKRTVHAFLIVGAAAAFAAVWAAGCHTAQKPQPITVKPTPTPPPIDPLALAITREQRYQPDVKMLARAEGETVSIELQNASDQPIHIDASNFGIILENDPRHEVHPFDSFTQRARFPRVYLRRGEIATGSITFKGLGNLAGQRLVFNHPNVRPSVALIQGDGAKEIAVPRVTPKPAPASQPASPTPTPEPATLTIPTPFPDAPGKGK